MCIQSMVKISSRKAFSQGYEYVTAVTDELQTLDDNIGRCVSASSQSVEKPKGQRRGFRT